MLFITQAGNTVLHSVLACKDVGSGHSNEEELIALGTLLLEQGVGVDSLNNVSNSHSCCCWRRYEG